jgi:hypothetical protein
MRYLETWFACKTVSEANRRDHWAVKAKRSALQKRMGYAMTKSLLANDIPEFPCTIAIVRLGPRLLDDDNLRGALKAIRDGIAKALGKDDSPENGISWEYRQEKKKGKQEVGIMIEIEHQSIVAGAMAESSAVTRIAKEALAAKQPQAGGEGK